MRRYNNKNDDQLKNSFDATCLKKWSVKYGLKFDHEESDLSRFFWMKLPLTTTLHWVLHWIWDSLTPTMAPLRCDQWHGYYHKQQLDADTYAF